MYWFCMMFHSLVIKPSHKLAGCIAVCSWIEWEMVSFFVCWVLYSKMFVIALVMLGAVFILARLEFNRAAKFCGIFL